MTPATKIASAIAAASTASAGGIYFGTDLLKKSSKEVKSTIASLIQKSNPEKRLLTSSTQPSDKAGKDAGAKYRNQNKESNSGGISSGTKTNSDVQGDVVAPNDFISKCASKSDLEVLNTDDSSYKEVLDYCTRDTLIKDLISGSKRLLVNSGDEDSAAGNKAGEAYKAKNTGNQQAQDKWALGDGNSQSSQGTAPTTFKQKCVDKSSSNAYSQSSLVEDYELVLEGCTTNV